MDLYGKQEGAKDLDFKQIWIWNKKKNLSMYESWVQEKVTWLLWVIAVVVFGS